MCLPTTKPFTNHFYYSTVLQALPTTHTLEGAHMFIDWLHLLMLGESPWIHMHSVRWVHPLCTLWTTQHMSGFDNKMRNYIKTFAHPNETHENEAPCFGHKYAYFKVSKMKLIDGSKWFLKVIYISYLDTYILRLCMCLILRLKSSMVIVHVRCTHLSSKGVFIHYC